MGGGWVGYGLNFVHSQMSSAPPTPTVFLRLWKVLATIQWGGGGGLLLRLLYKRVCMGINILIQYPNNID